MDDIAREVRKLRMALYVAVVVYVAFWIFGLVFDKAVKSIAFP